MVLRLISSACRPLNKQNKRPAFVDRFNDAFEDNEGFAMTNEDKISQVECDRSM